MTMNPSILKNILDFKYTHFEKVEMGTTKKQSFGVAYDQQVLNVYARPIVRIQCQCPVCRRKCAKDGFRQGKESEWRGPNLNGIPVIIHYRPQRILCPEHGALNEYIPWADGRSRFTAPFNDEVAWLVCQATKTAICGYVGINWRTVGNCVRASHERLEPDVSARIHDNVRRICVDETSYSIGHKYVTVVYDMDRNRVIWVHEGHGYEVFSEFCRLLTPDERARMEVVAGDGARWIDTCCTEFFPNATRCMDFFHVVQWINKALDEVRTGMAAQAKRDYNRLRDEYSKAEEAAMAAAEKAKREYEAALGELDGMPRRGRPSARKIELAAFVAEYEALHGQDAGSGQPKPTGRRGKIRLSPEHEASLKELSDIVNDFKGAKYALGHNPENCTDGQVEKLKLIENSYPELYRAYQLKENLRLILHMKDYDQASTELSRWIDEAKKSGIKPMQKLAEKIEERHKENILNAIKCQANSAKSESTNTTIKGLIKLARGFRNMDNMISLIYLKCSDIVVPLHNRPQPPLEYVNRKRERANELRRQREEQRRRDFVA